MALVRVPKDKLREAKREHNLLKDGKPTSMSALDIHRKIPKYIKIDDQPFGPEGPAAVDLLLDLPGSLVYENDLLDYIDIERLDEAHKVEKIAKTLPKLGASRRDCDIVLSRLAGETLESIGDRYGITRERTRQIQNVVVNKLKAHFEQVRGNNGGERQR